MASQTNVFRQRLKLRFGTHGSLSVDLTKAVFFDHENDKGGGILDLVKLRCGTGQAIAWLENEGFLPDASSSNGLLPNKRQIVATYDYLDQQGVLRSQVVQFEPKGFASAGRMSMGAVGHGIPRASPTYPIGSPSCWRQ